VKNSRGALAAWTAAVLMMTSSSVAAELDRTVLPIQLPKRPLYTEIDARNAEPPPRVTPVAPEGAPNVIIILIDDLGFGATETFGGPISTPSFDRLAEDGIRYNNFHTTALCSPTRAALKTGRNHHTANMGFITEMATGFPGATGERPSTVAPLATILQLNGYSTGAFGKWHETAAWETSEAGPFTRWPTGPNGGFDKFYGFIGGESNQWAPFLRDGTTIVELPEDPDYHLLPDMADQAIKWVKFQQALTPDKPFFVYFAPGATHAPHHVPQEWVKKWEGKFEKGWDTVRAETLARQIDMGLVPEGTKLAPKPKAIKDWDTLSDNEKKLFSHQASVFAAFLEYTDYEIGRFVKSIEDIGELDNTLIFFIAGDNGTSGEGGENGMFNEYTYFNGVHEKVEDMLTHLDSWGGPDTYPHMAAGWSVAFDAPFGWMKQVPSDFGGTRNGMVVHWPKGINAKNELRTQFSHVIDVAPTVLEAIGLPEPKVVNSTPQVPMEGTSLVYSFENADADERHTTQYFEIAGNRAIYHDGWYARKLHRAPWEPKPRGPLADDTGWQLYNVEEDFSLADDLAVAHPEKLKELQALFLEEAEKYHVLPMDDRVFERLDATLVGRPDIMAGRTSMTLAGGMTGMMETTFLNVKNKSKILTAEIEVPEDGGHGILIAQGGRFGGWALYVKDGIPAYDYNYLGMQRSTITGTDKLAPGPATVTFEFTYDGGGPGKGGVGILSVNGEKVAEGRIEQTQPGIFSADETADVGMDLGTPVVETIGSEARSRFNGAIPKLTVAIIPPKPADQAAGDAAVKAATDKIQEVPPAAPTLPPSIEAASFSVYDPGVAGSAVIDSVEVSASVVAVDHEKRQATLEGRNGKKFTVSVGPEAVNFDQVTAGDRVTALLTREIVAFVTDSDAAAGDGSAAVAARAEKGEQPGGMIVGMTQLVGTIIDLNHWKRLVTIEFEGGATEIYPVRPDIIMENYEVGQKVIFQVTEAVAVDVTKS